MTALLAGKVALVTGAQKGIGAAMARAFAAAGADVAVNYLDDRAAAESVAEAVRGHGCRALLVQGDVSDTGAAQAMVARVAAGLGGIDILVNNAGIFPRAPMLEVTEALWDRVLGVNLKGGFFCAQAAAQVMLAQGRGGAIIHLASAAIRGALRGVHYSASKGGIVAMTRAMALELAPHQIRVNAIAPGLTDTAQPRDGHDEAELAEMAKAIPLGRMATPEEIADAALYLAGPAGRFVTGQTLHVNGGSFMP